MKTIIYSTQYYERDYFTRLNRQGHRLVFADEPLSAASATLAGGCTGASILVHDRADAVAIAALAAVGIRLLTLRAAGFDNVDLKAAAHYSITVMRVPAYSPQAVAEHAVALLLAGMRHIPASDRRIKGHNFSLQGLMGSNLYQKTVGVVGTGRIGSAFSTIMLGFGCQVIAFDTDPSERLKALGINYVEFDTLLGKADIVSLHCPLNEGTRHLIDSAAIAKMKKGTVIVNTARGGVVRTPDIIQGLAQGRIGYYATDVYEGEERIFFRDLSGSYVPDAQFLQLSSFANVLITPHQGYFTQEAVDQIIATTLQNLSDFEIGGPLANKVPPADNANL